MVKVRALMKAVPVMVVVGIATSALLLGSLYVTPMMLTGTPTPNGGTQALSNTSTAASQGESLMVEYTRRLDAMSATCRRLGYTSLSRDQIPKNVLVERNHSILYCPIAKVGSTFWLRTLSVMSRGGEFTSPFQIKRTAKGLTSYAELSEMLPPRRREKFEKEATSFLFTRDPYTRLFSAYINKLYCANWLYWQTVGVKVVRAVRNSPPGAVGYGDDVTFAELVKYILMLHDQGKPINNHFKPMHMICNPCKMSYNFIGKLETFKDDVHYLLSEWKRKFTNIYVSFDDFEKESIMDSAKGYIHWLFNAYGHVKADKYPLYRLLLRTWKDLHIRGILSKSIPMPLSESASVNVTQESFLNLIEIALDHTANWDRKQVALQRHEAMVEAYRSVSAADMERLRLYLEPDCQLFGYDSRPSILFDRYFSDNEK